MFALSIVLVEFETRLDYSLLKIQNAEESLQSIHSTSGAGLSIAIGSMVYDFTDKGKKKKPAQVNGKDVEMAPTKELKFFF